MLIALLIINLFTLRAQHPALPITFTIAWDAKDTPTTFIVQQDTKVIGETSAHTYVVKVTSLGVHTFKITEKATGLSSSLVVRVTKDGIPLQP